MRKQGRAGVEVGFKALTEKAAAKAGGLRQFKLGDLPIGCVEGNQLMVGCSAGQ